MVVTARLSPKYGWLRPLAGQSQIIMNSNGSATGFVFAGLDTALLVRGGQIGFAGNTLGTGTTATITGVVGTNGVLPWGLAENDYVGDPFAEVNVTNYNSLLGVTAGAVRPLVTDATNSFVSGTANVLVTGATIGTGSANSLTLDSTSVLTLSGPLTVTSGALINRNVAGSITGAGPLSTPGTCI